MSTALYSYSPRPQQVVSVELPPDGAAEAVIAAQFKLHSRVCVSIPDAAVPEVARGILAALYEAAGLPVPIVLDRVDETMFASWIHVRDRRQPGTVLIDPHSGLGFAGARNLAAALVAAVERAEREPDPAEVEALAEVLHAARERCGGAGELDRQSARTILARYTLTERQPGGSDG